MKALDAKHTYLMRRMVGNVVKEKEDRLSSQQLQEMLGLEPIEKLIWKRKLQCVAHSAGRGEMDLTWSRMRRPGTGPAEGSNKAISSAFP